MASLSQILLSIFLITLIFVDGQPNQKRDKYDVLKEEWCGDYNCYEILEITPDVDFRDIKQRYNNLSLTLHPDKNPNQTTEEKERYVRINKAYEILSSKRRDYDEYLRIKVSLDSPIESPIIVLIILYLLIAGVVLYYQKQQQEVRKEAILQNASVVRYYWEQKKIDLTGKKKSPKKGKNKNKNKNASQNITEIKENINIDELNRLIKKLNLQVPGWKNTEPTYKQALIDVLSSILWLFSEVLFQIRWILKYKLLKQNYNDADREYLCRKHYNKSETEWYAMPEQDRIKLLNKPGKWRKKDKNQQNDNRNKRKRN
eukprot:954692_1